MRGDNYVTESGHRVIPIRENRGEKYFIVIILLYMFLEKNKLYSRTLLSPLDIRRLSTKPLCPKRKPNCTVKTHAIFFLADSTLALNDSAKKLKTER